MVPPVQLFPASIKNYLVATMACLCIPGVGALAYMASQSFGDVRENMRLANLVEADKALLIAGNSIRANRGQAQTAIQAADDPAPIIAKVEQANRKDLDEAVARLNATSLADRASLAEAVATQQKATDAKFADLRAEAAKPKAQRSLQATMPWYNGVGDIEAALVKAADATSLAVRLSDPIMADLQNVKSTGWRARSNYGIQCSVLRPHMASGKALEPAQIRRLGELRGVANSSMEQLRQMMQRSGVGADLARKVGVMGAEMEAANKAMDALTGKLGQGTAPLISAEDWTKLCNGPFTAMLSAITQSLDDMASTTQDKLNQAWTQLAVIGALLAALLAVCVLSWRGVQRRIAKPVVALKSALDVMQAGDFSQPIPAAASPDEIGALSGALEAYRENALSLEATRRDRELAMLADSQQAANVQKLLGEVAGIVSAAQNGDFSGHASVGDVGGPLGELVTGINEINAVVNGATTEFAAALQSVANGDLTHRVDTAYRGRFADLKNAINDTVDRLSATVKTIQVTSADVGLAAREINMGADDLSKRTEEQASSLEETAATTEELAASVKATAQASRNAAAIATEAMQAAQNGGAIAGQAVEAMSRIESASTKISDIIRVIDDIAFQTNLLALNAAVEAARAGDAGKGFAVVASEVRTLAQRSSEAAKDISALISSSNAEVGEGVKLVRQAGDSLSQILSASQKVAATIAEISAASGEQASGIDEMSQAVAHLDEMTQQNAALSEQSAASAASLSSRIGQLNDLVAAFRTGPDTGHGRPASTMPRRAA